MMRRELDVDREPERAGEEQAVLGPDGRPGDLDVLRSRADDDADEVRVVLRSGEALLGDVDPALGRDQGRVHLVHGLVDSTLERAVQRCDRQESRVVLRERAVDGDGDARGHAPASAIARRPSFAASGTNGPRISSSRGSTTGMLTAVRTTSPSSAAATCSAITTPARSCASAVDPARCGVTTTCGSPSSGPEYGSVSKTSSAAPATFPSRSPPPARPRRRGSLGPRSRSAHRPSSARRQTRRGALASRRSAGDEA